MNMVTHFPRWSELGARRRDALVVFCFALGLRVVFALLTSNTYDPDEFVILALSRAAVHGAVPYRDFDFFHPPGILVIMGALNPLTTVWWPGGRIAIMLADCGTALVTWRIGLELFNRRAALIAGGLYAASPLTLISGVRVGQDPLVALFGMSGLAVLLTGTSKRRALIAGACLGAAIWLKYPALLFLPVYVAAGLRRAPLTLASTGVVVALLFAPFVPVMHDLVRETVAWQQNRQPMHLSMRVEHVVVYWLVLNALAIPGCFLVRRPPWLLLGYALGGVFLFAPQVYYHYYVLVVPFAALLAAPVVVRAARPIRQTLPAAAVAITVTWGLVVGFGSPNLRLFTSATRLSQIKPAVRLLDRSTSPSTRILGDRYEYAYLAGRPPAMPYFWDMTWSVSARDVESHLGGVPMVLVTDFGGQSYPTGFLKYLATHGYSQHEVGSVDVWMARTESSVRRGAACVTVREGHAGSSCPLRRRL